MELTYIVSTKEKLVAAFPTEEQAKEVAKELSEQTGNGHAVQSVPIFRSMEDFFEHDAKYWRRKYEELKKVNSNGRAEKEPRSSYGSSGGGGHD
jgi:hypothetical protein